MWDVFSGLNTHNSLMKWNHNTHYFQPHPVPIPLIVFCNVICNVHLYYIVQFKVSAIALIYGASSTVKSFSEALLFAEYEENMLCTKIVLNVRNNFCTQHVLPRFELGIFMYLTCNLMNNLSSYCWLVDAKLRVSDKDLPVRTS